MTLALDLTGTSGANLITDEEPFNDKLYFYF